MLTTIPELDKDNLSRYQQMILAMDGFDGIHSLKDGIYIGGFNMNHLISEHILHEYPFSPWMWKENRTLPDEERIKRTLFADKANFI